MVFSKFGQGSAPKNAPGMLFSPHFDKFFRIHEKVMWQFNDLDYSSIKKELLTPEDIGAIRGAMLVESHNPVYTARILDYFRQDHELTSFVVTWAYEEMKHYAALKTYLEATGMVDAKELLKELDETRAGPWGEEEMNMTRVQSFTYTTLQEQVTGLFYKRFAESTKEPLLKTILNLVSKDEYRHCQFYLEKCKMELKEDKHLMDEVDDMLLRFQMPGPTFIKDYKKHSQAMLQVANMDVTAMKESLDKVSQVTGKLHLLKLTTNRAFHQKLRDEWGLDLGQALGALR